MTNYIKALKKELDNKQLSENEKEDIIKDHEEMIQEALADGLAEADLEKRFGSPEQVASELESQSDNEIVEDSVYDFSITAEDLKITIGLVNEDFNLSTSNDENLHVSFSEPHDKDKYDVSFDNNHLIVKRKNDLKLFSFNKNVNQRITVTVPHKHEVSKFALNMVNGDIDLKHMNMATATISVVNGDVNFNHFSIDQLKLNAVGGDAMLNQMSLTDCHVSLVSGDLEATHVDVQHQLTISTVSGDARLEHSTCESLQYHSVSGDLSGKEFYPKSIKFDSISGDVKINNEKKTDINIIKSSSISGKININA